jgi:hypothetical protein
MLPQLGLFLFGQVDECDIRWAVSPFCELRHDSRFAIAACVALRPLVHPSECRTRTRRTAKTNEKTGQLKRIWNAGLQHTGEPYDEDPTSPISTLYLEVILTHS